MGKDVPSRRALGAPVAPHFPAGGATGCKPSPSDVITEGAYPAATPVLPGVSAGLIFLMVLISCCGKPWLSQPRACLLMPPTWRMGDI